MRDFFHVLLWFVLGWILLLVLVYRTLGLTAQDQASLEFMVARGATLVGGLAGLIGLVAVAVRDYDSPGGGSAEPDDAPGKPAWDQEFETGSTGEPLEDLGLVKHEPPLPSTADSEDSPRLKDE